MKGRGRISEIYIKNGQDVKKKAADQKVQKFEKKGFILNINIFGKNICLENKLQNINFVD